MGKYEGRRERRKGGVEGVVLFVNIYTIPVANLLLREREAVRFLTV